MEACIRTDGLRRSDAPELSMSARMPALAAVDRPTAATPAPEACVQPITRMLPVSDQAPKIARDAIAPLTDELGSELARDTQLLISELVTHRVRRERAGKLRLDISLSAGAVRVEVTDDRRAAPPVRDSHEPTLGFELHIIAQLADRWGIRRNWLTSIWFELDR
jgi:hypothetical protein